MPLVSPCQAPSYIIGYWLSEWLGRGFIAVRCGGGGGLYLCVLQRGRDICCAAPQAVMAMSASRQCGRSRRRRVGLRQMTCSPHPRAQLAAGSRRLLFFGQRVHQQPDVRAAAAGGCLGVHSGQAASWASHRRCRLSLKSPVPPQLLPPRVCCLVPCRWQRTSWGSTLPPWSCCRSLAAPPDRWSQSQTSWVGGPCALGGALT